jgi:hypothetical protein
MRSYPDDVATDPRQAVLVHQGVLQVIQGHLEDQSAGHHLIAVAVLSRRDGHKRHL